MTDKIAKRGKAEVAKNTRRLTRLAVEYVDINSIKPNTYNPNRQDDETLELLTLSMKEDGFTQPIIAHRESLQIVDGEHRWRAGLVLGMTQVPVVFVEMTDEQMRIATLRHNWARGSEDFALGVGVLRDLQELGAIAWAQDSLMISDRELNELFADETAPESLAGEDFTEAWVPDRGEPMADKDPASVKLTHFDGKGGADSGVAMSGAAVIEAEDREERLLRAQTDEERDVLKSTLARPFRIRFSFTGEEADLVRGVLGDEPAERLLAICREILAEK